MSKLELKRKIFLLLLALSFFSSISFAIRAVPKKINIQGRLTDQNNIPLNGTYNLSFAIYDSSDTQVWPSSGVESHPNTFVDRGIFNVTLGSNTPINLDFNQEYWLEVIVNGSTLAPRQPLLSTPYSYTSNGTYNLKGTPTVARGNLDMNNKEILKFFQGSCQAGKVVNKINSDGTYSCKNVTKEILDLWVNESGDVMTGKLKMKANLNMSGNKIFDFFASACPNDEAIAKVWPNGSYVCTEAGAVEDIWVNESGDTMYPTLNITNLTSGNKVAQFTGTQIRFYQPLSVQAPGGLSVTNGIDLTDTTSNTIDSYSTFYLKTSSGSPTDIVLQPTGVVGVQSNLNLGGNNITNVNDIKNFFSGGCSDNSHITGISSSGSISCGSDSGDISAVSSGTGTKGGSNSGSATIEFDCSDVQGTEITCSGETIGVDEGPGNGLNADLLDGHEWSEVETNDEYLPEDPATSNVDMNGKDILMEGGVVNDTTGSLTLGGHVNIPNGNLYVRRPGKTVYPTFKGNGTYAHVRLELGNTAGDDYWWISYRTGSKELRFRSYNGTDHQYVLRLGRKGSVVIPNGDLNLGNNNINNVNKLGDVDSTAQVANLNADLLDGHEWSEVETNDEYLPEDPATSNVDMNGKDILMEGGVVNDTTGALTLGGNAYMPNGFLTTVRRNSKQYSTSLDRSDYTSAGLKVMTSGSGTNPYAYIHLQANTPDAGDGVGRIALPVSGGSGDMTFMLRSAGNVEEKMRIKNNGDVGIGTASPDARLDIKGGNLDMSGNSIENIGGKTDAAGGAIRLANDRSIRWRNSGNTKDHELVVEDHDLLRYRVGGSTAFQVTPGGTINLLGSNIKLSGGYISNDGSNEGLRVDDSGNVEIPNGDLGIGTSPSYKLDVAGDAKIGGNLYVQGNLTKVNVQTVTVNGTMEPFFDKEFDLGSPSKWWQDLYVKNIHSDEGEIDDVYVNEGGDTMSGPLNMGGNNIENPNLIEVMDGKNGGNQGLAMWKISDTNWGIYMGQAGSGRSFSGGNAVAGDGFSSHAIRFRAYNGGSNGFIWENSNEKRLMSLRSSDGFLSVSGDLDMNNNNIDDIASIDGGGNAIQVNDNLDMNGNSIGSTGGEICIGNNCPA